MQSIILCYIFLFNAHYFAEISFKFYIKENVLTFLGGEKKNVEHDWKKQEKGKISKGVSTFYRYYITICVPGSYLIVYGSIQ